MADAMEQDAAGQRMAARYAEMTDGELEDLAEGLENLTETARAVLGRELARRGLLGGGVTAAPTGRVVQAAVEGDELIALTTFYDALAARRACEHLEAAGVDFALEDISEPESGLRSFEGGPPVALRLRVAEADRTRAMSILRETVGLFPLQEVEVADEVLDDGSVASVGSFAAREEAEQVAGLLEDAGIWHRVVANPEGSAEDEDAYLVEVREVDLFAAGDVVERGLG